MSRAIAERSLTMHTRRICRCRLGLMLCVLTAASACAPGGGSADPGVQPGVWEGAGAQGLAVTFTVSPEGNALTLYSFFYTVKCTKSPRLEGMVSSGQVPLKGGKFELSSDTLQVTANFISPGQAQGTWTAKAHQSLENGDCPEVGGTWAATPKDANAPTPMPPTAGPVTAAPPAAAPTLTTVPPTFTPIPPTATPLPTNTPASSSPALPAGAVFSGPLLNDLTISGILTFTIGTDGASIEGWSFDILGALPCAEGGTVSKITMQSDMTVPVENQAFEYVSEAVTFRGTFDSAGKAAGSFQQKLGLGKSACTIGPLEWEAASGPAKPPATPPAASPTRAPTPTSRPSASPTPKAPAGAAPVLQSVKLRNDTSSGSLVIYQDITFSDPDGDAYKMDFELVRATTSGVRVADGTIDTPSQVQKRGATLTGTWTCGGEQYDVTLRVTILDRAGNRSNAIEYTMECR